MSTPHAPLAQRPHLLSCSSISSLRASSPSPSSSPAASPPLLQLHLHSPPPSSPLLHAWAMWALTFLLSLLLLALLSPQAQSTRPLFFHQLQHHHHPRTIAQSQSSHGELIAAAGQPTNPIAALKESSEHQDEMAASSISTSGGLSPNPISPTSAGSPVRVNSESKGAAAAAKRLRRALIDAKSREAMITPMPSQPGENLSGSVFKSMLPRGVPVPPSGPSRSHNSKITDSD